MKTRPDFSEVFYNPSTIRWGLGNYAVGLQEIASIRLRPMSKTEEKNIKADYEKATKIFDKIRVGQRFIPSGDKAIKGVVAKITFIHWPKQTVSWKQVGVDKDSGLKPACGKWIINDFIAMVKGNYIEFTE